MTGYPLNRLYQEVAYIAYHFHWPADQILQLEHCDRQRWVSEIVQIVEASRDAAMPHC